MFKLYYVKVVDSINDNIVYETEESAEDYEELMRKMETWLTFTFNDPYKYRIELVEMNKRQGLNDELFNAR
ncbi:hypothetical protein ACFLQN_02710 [Candidatus Aenigmatarchaeota archaeon]